MADNILFKSGLVSKLNDITKVAGQLLFAIDGTSGSIYLDKDTNTRIKMNLDATKLQNAINIKINSIANDPIETANLDGSQNVSLNIPKTITNFTKIGATTFEGALKGNADTAAVFNSNRTISLTGAVTGSVSSNGENGWSINTTIAGKYVNPSNFATTFRTQTKGDANHGNYLSVIRSEYTNSLGYMPQYGSGIAFGIGDTQTYLYTDYGSTVAYIGGGSGNNLNWVKRIAFTDGTGASGTWGISITGNAATASKLGTSTVGSSTRPIYLNGGTATASSSTVGNSLTPVYLNGGTITQGETFGNRLYSYNAGRVYYYSFGGAQDLNWKKVFAASHSSSVPSSATYIGCTVKGTIHYFKGNYNQAEVEEYPFQMNMTFYSATTVSNECTLRVAAGCPDTIIRAVRVTTNSFELQVRQPADWTRIAIQFSYSGAASTMNVFEPVNATNTSVIPFSRLTTSKYVSDATNGTPITLSYGSAGLSSTSWLAAWNGYELRAISPTNTRNTIGAMAAINANGYYGMGTPSGGTSDWIRTTVSGIIPYQAGGSGSLGTSSWPFNTAYINTVSGNLSGNASSATKLQTARNIFGRSFDGTYDVAGRALFYGYYNGSVNNRFGSAALEIRENDLVANAQSDIGYAPQIGFHWSNRVAGTLALDSDANFRLIRQNGEVATLIANLAGYASSAGSSTWASLLSSNSNISYVQNSFQYFNYYGNAGAVVGVNDTPTTQWWHILRCTHANSNGFYTDVAIPFNDNQIYYKRIMSGAVQNGGWVMVYDTNNLVYSSSEPSGVKVGTIWLKPI